MHVCLTMECIICGLHLSVSHLPPPSLFLYGRTASVAQASCPLGAMAAGTPAGCAAGHDITAPPPLPWARPADGAGGREGGARAWWTFLAPSRPRSLQRHGKKGHRVNPLLPGTASSRGLQGGFELGKIQVPPHPSAHRGSRVLQGRIWGRLLLWVRDVKDRVVHLSPRCGAAPPPFPPWAGRAGTGTQQCDQGWLGSKWGRPSAAPLAAQGRGSPYASPRGGALEPGLHLAGAAIGRAGRPTPQSRTCGRGRGSTQPEICAGLLLGGSHIGWRPRPFRRAAIRWGAGGVRASYICIQLYIDELSPTNPLIPSIALASGI